jgi:TonB family protein
MRFAFRLLASITCITVSGINYAQSSGTAFVVAPGLLVTNHHVIDGCGVIEVIAADGRRPVTVVDSVQQIDLALLRVYGLRGGVASLRTKSATLLGESATVFGFPLGGSLSSTGNFTTGVVSSLRGLRDAAGEIQITAPVQPGNSGGPVLDRAGSVIGVVQSKLDALKAVRATGDIPQNVNFAVSLDVLADFLEKNNVPFNSAARQPAIETTQVAEMAQSFTYKISCKAASRTTAVPRPQAPPPALTPPVTKTPVPIAPATPTPSKLVQDIQTALNQKGFNAGPANGFIDSRTKEAIVAAQRILNLTVNGIPSDTLLTAIINMAVVVNGNTLQDGIDAYKRKEYQTALLILRRFALEGQAQAQNLVGYIYSNGQGVAQDLKEAVRWYKLSADQGNALGQSNLGIMYRQGRGVDRDYVEAFKLFQLSADQGSAFGQNNLGIAYENGQGVSQNVSEALKWYRLSAAQGNANAKQNISRINMQAGGSSSDGYGAKVKACVQPGVSFPVPPRGNANPMAQFRVDLRPDGTVASVKLSSSSGNPNFDRAVETGIRRCSPFPVPPSGRYPGFIDIIYNMYD